MNNNLPIISVMMPAYNAGRYISYTIDSILAQTFQDWELICYDDGSSDDTAAIVEKYAEYDSRIKLFHGEHSGRGKARNEVLKHCRGEFIAVCDADDVNLPLRFQMQLDFLRTHVDISAVGSNLIPFYGNCPDSESATILWPETSSEIASRFDNLRMAMPNCSVLIRSSCFVECGGFDEALLRCQDFGLFLKLHRHGHKFYNIQEPLVYYRQDAKIPSYKYWLDSEKYHDLAVARANGLSDFQPFIAKLKRRILRAIPWVRYANFYLKRLRARSS